MENLLFLFLLYARIFPPSSSVSTNNSFSITSEKSDNTGSDKQMETNSQQLHCRIHNGSIYPVVEYLHSIQVPDNYLLTTCRLCLDFTIALSNYMSYTLNQTNSTEMEMACSSINSVSVSATRIKDCISRVTRCCRAAEECCVRQAVDQIKLTENKVTSGYGSSSSSSHSNSGGGNDSKYRYSYNKQNYDFYSSRNIDLSACPITWDGLACVNKTSSGSIAQITCPTFVPNFFDIIGGEKVCGNDGKWMTKQTSGIIWEPTVYTNCLMVENEIIICYVRIAFLSLSILLLIISTSLFLSFRGLRIQNRIRIHVNLFAALLMKTLLELFTTVAITLTTYLHLISIQNPDSQYSGGELLLENNDVCKWFTILMRYFQNCSFCWMLCEALFLNYLLFRAFERVSSLKYFMLIGWVVPLIYTGLYVVVRWKHPALQSMDKKCWVEELPGLEYILKGPNALSLALNIIFLVNIVRLIRRIPTTSSDHQDWIYTFKAVMVLVPLFGLHLLLVAVTIPRKNPFYLTYSIIQSIVQDSQGTAVSLAFCAFNEEVRNTIKRRISRLYHNYYLPHHSANPRPSNRSSRKLGSSLSKSMHNSNVHGSIPLLLRPQI